MNNRITKTMRAKAGFTLVELIVVIAILGILAGVGTVGYSGYIKKANMAADQQLARDIEYAAQLAYINNSNAFGTTTHHIVLSTNATVGPKYLNDADDALKEAVEAYFGSNASNLALKYDWAGVGGNVVTTKKVVENFNTLKGDSTLGVLFDDNAENRKAPTFANDVDDLFEVIKTTAMSVAGQSGTGAALVQGAADITMSGTTAEAFAANWQNPSAWSNEYLMGAGNGGQYAEDSIDDAKDKLGSESASDADKQSAQTLMNNAIANAAVIKARNTSFATYMRNHSEEYGGYGEDLYDIIANYSLGTSIIPQDTQAVGNMTLANALKSRYPEKYASVNARTIAGIIGNAKTAYYGTSTTPDKTSLPSYADALAYYTMMNTVQATKNDASPSDDAYWNEMKTGVSLYGSVARKETNVDDLDTVFSSVEEGVVISFTAKNEKLVSNNPLLTDGE